MQVMLIRNLLGEAKQFRTHLAGSFIVSSAAKAIELIKTAIGEASGRQAPIFVALGPQGAEKPFLNMTAQMIELAAVNTSKNFISKITASL